MNISDVIIPIAVSCVMPIALMWLLMRAIIKKSEHKANVMIKAIENGAEINPDVFKALTKQGKSTRMKLVNRLEAGAILSLVGLMFVICAACGLGSFEYWGFYPGIPLLAAGIGFLASFFFGMNFLKTQMESEENK
jgi:hypothetical protein